MNQSMIFNSESGQKIFPVKIIKYEDLVNKTFDTFRDIVKFIQNNTESKRKFNHIRAQNSVKSTNFNNMKNIEKNSGFQESVLSKNDSKKIPFFHLGPKNNWKNIFDQNYQKKLNLLFDANLKELNYF